MRACDVPYCRPYAITAHRQPRRPALAMPLFPRPRLPCATAGSRSCAVVTKRNRSNRHDAGNGTDELFGQARSSGFGTENAGGAVRFSLGDRGCGPHGPLVIQHRAIADDVVVAFDGNPDVRFSCGWLDHRPARQRGIAESERHPRHDIEDVVASAPRSADAARTARSSPPSPGPARDRAAQPSSWPATDRGPGKGPQARPARRGRRNGRRPGRMLRWHAAQRLLSLALLWTLHPCG